MKRSISYKAVPVKNVSLHFLKNVSGRSPIHVGIDIGKHKLYVSVRWSPPRSKAVVHEHPWFVENTNEIPDLVAKLKKIKAQNKLVVGIESTGSYGDPLRQALHDAGITVHQVRTKLTHDYAEIFDGVPSQHDGKDAAVIAELVSQGKSTPWSYKVQDDTINEMRYHVRNMIEIQKDIQRLRGKLEGLVARYWPEISSILPLTSLTLQKILNHYGGPKELSVDKNAVDHIVRLSRGIFSTEKAATIRDAAKSTRGVRQGPWDSQVVKDVTSRMIELHKQSLVTKKRLKEMLELSCEPLQRMASALGPGTAAIVWCRIGDPRGMSLGRILARRDSIALADR